MPVFGMSRGGAARLAGAIAWLAYFLIPAKGGWVDGIPAGPVDAAGIALVLWIAAHGVRFYAPAAVLLVGVVAAAASAAIPGHPGFQARQFANAHATGTHER